MGFLNAEALKHPIETFKKFKNSKTNVRDQLRNELSNHTWNYKNRGPMSHGWYL